MSDFSERLDLALDADNSLPDIDDTCRKLDKLSSRINELIQTVAALESDAALLRRDLMFKSALYAKSQNPDADIAMTGNNLVLGDDQIDFENLTANDENFDDSSKLISFLIRVLVPEQRAGKGRLVLEGKKISLLDISNYLIRD